MPIAIYPDSPLRPRAVQHADRQERVDRLPNVSAELVGGNALVRRMLDVIDIQYADAVTIRSLSATMGRQPAYVGRLFRHEVGVSVRDYLTRVRLEHAAALIRDGVKIEAVALSVGYRSKKNFYQQFRKHYGTTPLLYRHGLDTPAGSDTPLVAPVLDGTPPTAAAAKPQAVPAATDSRQTCSENSAGIPGCSRMRSRSTSETVSSHLVDGWTPTRSVGPPRRQLTGSAA